MSKSSITIIALALALVLSNALWAYNLSFGDEPDVTPLMKCEPSEQSAEIIDALVMPLIATIASSAQSGATKESIVADVSRADLTNYNFCIEDRGVVRVRGIGLKFDESKKLVGATATYCPP